MGDPRLPSFMVIGAVKAATTWISEQLRHHPALWLPKAEPHFFSTEFDRGLDWYRGLFAEAPANSIVGEKSADYLAHPEAAARIAVTLPEIPMIAQLRDPVARAYSDYCMLFRRGAVGGDPGRYLDPDRASDQRFLRGGLYADHIRRLNERLPHARLKIFFYEAVLLDPEGVMREVCDHLAIPHHMSRAELRKPSNDSRSPMLPLPLRRALRPARPLLDPLRANRLFARIHRSMVRPVVYPPLGKPLANRLRDYYRQDIEMLEVMLDRDLSAWLQDREARNAQNSDLVSVTEANFALAADTRL